MLNRISYFGIRENSVNSLKANRGNRAACTLRSPLKNFYAKGLKYASNVVVLLLLVVDDVLANKQRY